MRDLDQWSLQGFSPSSGKPFYLADPRAPRRVRNAVYVRNTGNDTPRYMARFGVFEAIMFVAANCWMLVLPESMLEDPGFYLIMAMGWATAMIVSNIPRMLGAPESVAQFVASRVFGAASVPEHHLQTGIERDQVLVISGPFAQLDQLFRELLEVIPEAERQGRENDYVQSLRPAAEWYAAMESGLLSPANYEAAGDFCEELVRRLFADFEMELRERRAYLSQPAEIRKALENEAAEQRQVDANAQFELRNGILPKDTA